MKRILLVVALFASVFTLEAQKITVTGGPGRVNNNTVIIGQPFTVSVTGLNGTVKQWSAGIGSVQGVALYQTNQTSVSNVIIDRAINGGSIGLVSVGATNGNGVSAYLNLQAACTAQLFLVCTQNSFGQKTGIATVSNATGATSYTWRVNSGAPFTTTNNQIQFPAQTGTNFVTVTVNGGGCNGLGFNASSSFTQCLQKPGFEERAEEDPSLGGAEFKAIDVFPNPIRDGEVNLNIPSEANAFVVEIVTLDGRVVKTTNLMKSETSLDVKGLPAGVYFMQVTGNDGFYQSRRLVIE